MARDDDAWPSASTRVLLETTFGPGGPSRADELARLLARARGDARPPKPRWPAHAAPEREWGDAERIAIALETLLERRRRAVKALWVQHAETDPTLLALDALARCATGPDATVAHELAAIDALLAPLAKRLDALEALAEGSATPRERRDRLGAAAVAELGLALVELRTLLAGGEIDAIRERAGEACLSIASAHPGGIDALASAAQDDAIDSTHSDRADETAVLIWILGSSRLQRALVLLGRAYPLRATLELVQDLRASASHPEFAARLRRSRGDHLVQRAMEMIEWCGWEPRTIRRWRCRSGLVPKTRADNGAKRNGAKKKRNGKKRAGTKRRSRSRATSRASADT